jgi:hypothetical protein
MAANAANAANTDAQTEREPMTAGAPGDAKRQPLMANGIDPLKIASSLMPSLGDLGGLMSGVMGPRPTTGLTPAANAAQPLSSTGFDAQARGQEPHMPLDLELAKLSENVYQNEGAPPGWTRVPDDQLRARGIDPGLLNHPSGLQAAVYEDGAGNHVLAYRGNDGPDAPAVVAQALNQPTHQFPAAAELARQVKGAYGDNVIFTGHSHGGTLASQAALATGGTAVTFNAGGLSDQTLKDIGFDDPAQARAQAEAGQIRRYNTAGDWATLLQQGPIIGDFLPDALGHELRLPYPGGGFPNLMNAHELAPLIQSLSEGNVPTNPGPGREQFLVLPSFLPPI